jgi:hypothetical protein
MRNVYHPTRVVTVTISAVFSENDTLTDEELVDVVSETLAGSLPDGFHYSAATGHVVGVSHTPER